MPDLDSARMAKAGLALRVPLIRSAGRISNPPYATRQGISVVSHGWRIANSPGGRRSTLLRATSRADWKSALRSDEGGTTVVRATSRADWKSALRFEMPGVRESGRFFFDLL